MKHIVEFLKKDAAVSDYKVNITKKDSFEMFFVKGKLETVRSTDTCDKQVTVYVDHDGFRGDARFFVYPATTDAELQEKLDEAVKNARAICNAPYTLPEGETGEFQVPTNLTEEPMPVLVEKIAKAVFGANTLEHGSLNSVEVFLDHCVETVGNSRGLLKTQTRWTAMVEAIPTYNGQDQSVELYEQYNFSALDPDTLAAEISRKMDEVRARYEAVKPDFAMDCPVVLGRLELGELFGSLSGDLNYSTVYSHGNLFHKGDRVQKQILGDPITLTMKGSAEGCVSSACFDGDGMSLGEITLIRDGLVENYYGSNRFGQYLEEKPTGNLGCLCVAPGTADLSALTGPWLEVLSMSGLQVDFFNDYIGGEIRLANYHDGDRVTPVTGISISGKLGTVLEHIRLSQDLGLQDSYLGPAHAILSHMKIF